MKKRDHQKSRRDFLKKVGYTAPVILTMKAAPAFAKSGSGITRCKDGIGHRKNGIFDDLPRGVSEKLEKHQEHNVFSSRRLHRTEKEAKLVTLIRSRLRQIFRYFT